MRFVRAERVGGSLELRDVDGQIIGRLVLGEAAMPEIRKKRVSAQMRWKNGSYLTRQQRTDEEYQSRMGIA